MEIRHDNVIYISNISKLGGVEQFAYYMVKEYKDLDICVVTKRCDSLQMARLLKYAPVYIHTNEDIYCKTIVINYDTSILNFVKTGDAYMVVHGDYTMPYYKIYPDFKHPKLKKVLCVTQTLADRINKKFGVECECCYNPFVPEDNEKKIVLISATRLSKEKGIYRMKRLAQELDLQKVNYIWYVFTNDPDSLYLPNVIFIPSRLDVSYWIKQADYLVQLSDTEACSYSINEARAYGVQTITTPLPYLEEIGITNENSLILDFDLNNIKNIVERIKKPTKVNWTIPQDNYNNILANGKSKYEEMKNTMAILKVTVNFRDMQNNGIERKIGEEFVCELPRAKQIVAAGYGTIIDEQIEKKVPVEKAVKEVKKEKAIIEKAVKVIKKNAKK